MSTNFLYRKGGCEQDVAMSPDVNTSRAHSTPVKSGPRRRDVEGTQASGTRPPESRGPPGSGVPPRARAHTRRNALSGRGRVSEDRWPPRAPYSKEPGRQGLQPERGEGPGAVELPEGRRSPSSSPPGRGSEGTPDPPTPPGSLLRSPPNFGVSALKVKGAGPPVPSRSPTHTR